MNVQTLTDAILSNMPEVGKYQSNFLRENFLLQCQLHGRHNFLNMSRYSGFNEGTFHNNYKKDFDFFEFNRQLVDLYSSGENVLAFDPSFVNKRGKYTPGLGYFWSGCAGTTKRGLEIGGFASVDIINNTALHLIADQTLASDDYTSLLKYYAALVCLRAEDLQKVSNRLAVDAYFSRAPFVDATCAVGFTIISRLRKDANLSYLYVGPHPKRKGPKTKYAGKFDPKNPDFSFFTCCVEEEDFRIFEATLYSVSMKRKIRVALKHEYRADGSLKTYKIYFSTDLTMLGAEIYLSYKGRFQIEFLYRDSKQFTGLEHCQSKSSAKMHFHYNTALTTVSIAKALYHLSQPIEERNPFSMADVKTEHLNKLLWDLIITKCGIDPHKPLIIEMKKNFLSFGKIRA